MDFAVDNPDVLRESIQLTKVVNGKENVQIIRLHSFEFALLSFDLLEQWVFAEKDELKDKRQNFLDAVSDKWSAVSFTYKFVPLINYIST